ncbi:KTSC domain-containing protein [Desulfuromusa kysingii]|uniref:KTSC domain-containing protein n=1 Tax=Desulfuromusa kysingii TaxID=37625 RepID=A0A1H3Z049_9BACT|nr:KTSC domain-containing protein [Desulfuromusa kysingii]SEA17066.1 KTSC domain-containing protein [Desulfuromusa kysingii]
MERQSVSSSNIASIGYDNATEVLEVEFLNGSVYEYRNVTPVVYEELMNAASHGSYFNREIRMSYPYEKIG